MAIRRTVLPLWHSAPVPRPRVEVAIQFAIGISKTTYAFYRPVGTGLAYMVPHARLCLPLWPRPGYAPMARDRPNLKHPCLTDLEKRRSKRTAVRLLMPVNGGIPRG